MAHLEKETSSPRQRTPLPHISNITDLIKITGDLAHITGQFIKTPFHLVHLLKHHNRENNIVLIKTA